MMKIREKLSIAGASGIIIGVLLIVMTRELPQASAQFPFFIGCLMVILGLLEVGQSAWSTPSIPVADTEDPSPPADLKPVLAFIATAILYVVLLPVLGFYVMSFAFMSGGMLLMGTRKLTIVLGVPIIALAVIYYVFTIQLQVPLPQGALV